MFDRWASVAIVAVSLLIQFPAVFWGLPGGKFMVGGLVILDGGIPYRDFWSMYAPGSFYLVAALFGLFGQQVIVQGIAAIMIKAMTAGVFFRLLRRLRTPRMIAVLLAAMFIGMFLNVSPEVDTYGPTLLLLLLAIGRMLRYFESAEVRFPAQAGLLLGLAALFKHDVAAYAAAGFVMTIFLARFSAGDRRAAPQVSRFRTAAGLLAASLVPILPVALFLAWTAGPEAWDNLFVFPATTFARVFGEPYPSLLPTFHRHFERWLQDPSNLTHGRTAFTGFYAWVTCHFAEFVFVSGLFAVVFRRSSMALQRLNVAILCLALLPFFWMAAHVQQNTHLYSMGVLSMLLGGSAWHGLGDVKMAGRRIRPALATLSMVWGMALLIPTGMDLFRVALDFAGSRQLDLPTARWVRVSDGDFEVYQSITTLLTEQVPASEPIWVGLARHDAAVVTNMRFYYLAQRSGSIRYYELHPGVIDRHDVQAEIQQAIEDGGVRYAVIWRFGWSDTLLDSIKARRMEQVEGLGSKQLDVFLATAFEPIVEHGEYVVLRRRDGQGNSDESH